MLVYGGLVSDYDWLKRHTEDILELTYPIETIEPCIVNKFGPWAVVKLISLKYFISIYTTIISKQDWVDQMRYIDLLAGSGLNEVSTNGDLIAGSPIIAANYPRKKFDALHLVEKDSINANALKKRINSSNISTQIINESCNTGIDNILNLVGDSDHYLAFVDCESGMEITWDTMHKLLSKSGDVIFNFQTASVYRVISAWQSNQNYQHNSLDLLYGDESWKNFHSRDECLFGYIEKIRANSNREVVIPCRINGPGSYHYDLIIATRKTRGGSPYMDAVRELSTRVENLRPNFIQSILDILKGRRKSLDSYFL